MSVLNDYLLHVRFTLGEFRANVRRLGLGPAARFFVMRACVPFGRPRRYFMRRRSRSAAVSSIDTTAFAELSPVDTQTVRCLLDQLLASVSRQSRMPACSVEEYVNALASSQIERHTGLVSDGGADCVAARVARSACFANLATEYLERDPRDLIVEATVDTLVPVDTPGAAGGYDNALEFHRDIDGYRFIKMFVYLTDCFEGHGHHEIYLRSHRHYPLRLGPIKRYSVQQIEKHIPAAVLKKVTGPAGYVFAENTLAFHRGTRPRQGFRIILNLIYTERAFSSHFPNAFGLEPARIS